MVVSCPLREGDNGQLQHFLMDFAERELLAVMPAYWSVLSIDGLDGVGKSPLSSALSAKLEVPHVGLDSFLRSNQGTFLEALDYPAIRADIASRLASCHRVIIEGCMVGEVLRRLHISSDYKIYLLRTSRLQSGDLDDQIDEYELLCENHSAETLIEQEERIVSVPLPPELGGGEGGSLTEFRREMIKYHCRHRPYDSADLQVRIVRSY